MLLILLSYSQGVNVKYEVTVNTETTLTQYNLKWKLLRCVKINDGENIRGEEKDLVGQIYKACENLRHLKPVVICGIIHQQALCRDCMTFHELV